MNVAQAVDDLARLGEEDEHGRQTGQAHQHPDPDLPTALAGCLDVYKRQALIRILRDAEAYRRPAETIADSFAPAQTAAEYVRLFDSLRQGHRPGRTLEPTAYERLRALGG